MARDYAFITAVLGAAMRALFSWQRRQAKEAGHAGASELVLHPISNPIYVQ